MALLDEKGQVSLETSHVYIISFAPCHLSLRQHLKKFLAKNPTNLRPLIFSFKNQKKIGARLGSFLACFSPSPFALFFFKKKEKSIRMNE